MVPYAMRVPTVSPASHFQGIVGTCPGINFVPCDIKGTATGTALDCSDFFLVNPPVGHCPTTPGPLVRGFILYFVMSKVQSEVGPRSEETQFFLQIPREVLLQPGYCLGRRGGRDTTFQTSDK